MGAITTELMIDGLESPNQIQDISTGARSAGGGAEVRPAAKGAVLVDDAVPILGQHRASAIPAFGQLRAAARSKRPRGEQGFAFGEQRHHASEAKLTAFGQTRARALHWTVVQFGIDSLYFGEGASRIHRIMRHEHRPIRSDWLAIKRRQAFEIGQGV